MKQALIAIFALGWIDIFNAVAISMVLVLLSMVRKRWHVLIYVYGAYLAYVAASIAIFFGVDRYLADVLTKLITQYTVASGIVLAIIGICALIGCIVMIIYLIRAIRRKIPMRFEKVLFIKSVAPWFIFLLSFGSTWSCMVFAYPMLSFIGVLVVNEVSMVDAIWLIAVFCLFSFGTTLGVYMIATRAKGEKLRRTIDLIYRIMNGFCLFSIPIVLMIISCISLIYGIRWLGA